MTSPLKHRKGLIGTVIFHGMILFLLLFMAFRTPLPLPEEEGIMVDFGDSFQGFGSYEPLFSEPTPVPQTSPQASQDVEELVTQDMEESVALPSTPAVRPSETVAETPRETAPAAEQPQPAVERAPDQRAMFPGRGDSPATNQGVAGGQGNQGTPTGAPNVHVYGEGIEVGGGLAGRGISGNMPRPIYNVNEQGVVVVEVRVDRDGNVTSARAGARGTTILNSTLHDAAVRAALQTKFERSNILEQTGTITYTFQLN